jgi:hypothetical protein
VAEIVPQVLDALFTCMRLQEERWTARAQPLPVTWSGAARPLPDPVTAADGAGYAAHFREGLSALGPILEGALQPATLEALRARGHEVREIDMTSGLQGIVRVTGRAGVTWAGGADPRREGVALGD